MGRPPGLQKPRLRISELLKITEGLRPRGTLTLSEQAELKAQAANGNSKPLLGKPYKPSPPPKLENYLPPVVKTFSRFILGTPIVRERVQLSNEAQDPESQRIVSQLSQDLLTNPYARLLGSPPRLGRPGLTVVSRDLLLQARVLRKDGSESEPDSYWFVPLPRSISGKGYSSYVPLARKVWRSIGFGSSEAWRAYAPRDVLNGRSVPVDSVKLRPNVSEFVDKHLLEYAAEAAAEVTWKQGENYLLRDVAEAQAEGETAQFEQSVAENSENSAPEPQFWNCINIMRIADADFPSKVGSATIYYGDVKANWCFLRDGTLVYIVAESRVAENPGLSDLLGKFGLEAPNERQMLQIVMNDETVEFSERLVRYFVYLAH